jgi:hypothetical protein
MTPVGLRAVVVVLLAVGYRYATDIADYEEKVDAIGSKRSSEAVEAAEWKRTLYRGVFGGATLLAVGWTLLGVGQQVA